MSVHAVGASVLRDHATMRSVVEAKAELAREGFEVELEADESGGYWCHLVNPEFPPVRAPRYGIGSTEAEAIESAWRRYQVEQLGIV